MLTWHTAHILLSTRRNQCIFLIKRNIKSYDKHFSSSSHFLFAVAISIARTATITETHTAVRLFSGNYQYQNETMSTPSGLHNAILYISKNLFIFLSLHSLYMHIQSQCSAIAAQHSSLRFIQLYYSTFLLLELKRTASRQNTIFQLFQNS